MNFFNGKVKAFAFFLGFLFFFFFFTNSVKWQSETLRLGFSIQQCDTRLWTGKKQICFAECCWDQGLFIRWRGSLYKVQFRKKIPLYERHDGEEMREGANFFVFESERHITWSFWSLICRCFAHFFWLNWKAVFGRILHESLAPFVPIVLMPEEGPSFPLLRCLSYMKSCVPKGVEKPTCMQ